ncbi:uncharacterized protein TNCV_1022221 [Trichonephila clavipes]|nr:uncharacterized protein TNCV_1022221 [Trichonephila clavipes]
MRRNYFLIKYFNKKLSYGDQHRTSQCLTHWKDNQRLKRNSPFSQALTQNPSFKVEHHCQTSFIKPILGLQRIMFHYKLMPNDNKMSDHPELLKQLALEVIKGIPLYAAKIYTDGTDPSSNINELAIYRRHHQQEYSSPFSTAVGSTPYSSTVGPFSYRPSRERSHGRPCKGGYQQSCGSERPHGPYID